VNDSSAGYSGTSLWKKLGIREGATVLAVNAPANYVSLFPNLPANVSFVDEAKPPVGFVHFFVTEKAELASQLPQLLANLASDGVIWVSWPKKAAKVKTDITEDTLREVALPLGLVDVKVCAVDAVWSGLKLVIRVANRKKSR
jgi:hypothetical protein